MWGSRVRVSSAPPELSNCQGLTNKVPGNFLFIVLTVAGTYGFSAESKRLLFSTLNHTSNSILHHFFGKSLWNALDASPWNIIVYYQRFMIFCNIWQMAQTRCSTKPAEFTKTNHFDFKINEKYPSLSRCLGWSKRNIGLMDSIGIHLCWLTGSVHNMESKLDSQGKKTSVEDFKLLLFLPT